MESPVISGMPSNITLPTDNGTAFAKVFWTDPTATDYYGVHNTLVNFTSSNIAGNGLPIGNTAITYTAEDVAGNINAQSFVVTVIGK